MVLMIWMMLPKIARVGMMKIWLREKQGSSARSGEKRRLDEKNSLSSKVESRRPPDESPCPERVLLLLPVVVQLREAEKEQ